jgi:LmbE family N-acetylglucosaminyl deacetylase
VPSTGAPTIGRVPPARQIVVSTHFDDAALSLAHVLQRAGARATVVTVCGGAPPPDVAASAWDARAGFASGREAAEVRAGEDRAACALTGARPHPLPHPDTPYGPLPDGSVLRAEIAPLLEDGCTLWLPAGIGNEDHAHVREALLPLASAVPAGRMRLFADLPYAGTGGVELAEEWEMADAAFACKLEAVRCHASQIPLLQETWLDMLDRDGPLAREGALADPAPGVILQT